VAAVGAALSGPGLAGNPDDEQTLKGKARRSEPVAHPVAFRLVLAVAPLLILGLLEGGLRVAGVARPPRYFLENRVGDRVLLSPNPEIGKRFFPPSLGRVIPLPNSQFLDLEKRPGTRRIICIGESTTAGFPFPVHGGFPALLETLLNERDTSRRWEVVNCGLTGISSATVANLIDEMLRARPDELVIYLGHNEFFGAGGVASRRHALAGWMEGLRGLRLYRLMESIVSREPSSKPGTLMERLAARSQIPPDSRLRETARKQFARNLERILGAATRANARVILCEVASNERDLYPFGAVRPLGEAGEAVRAWRGDRPDAEAARATLPGLETASARDTVNAGLRYLLGVARLRVEDARAAGDFRAARNFDTVPFRAPDAINRELRSAAKAHRSVLVPTTQILAAVAPGGIPGEESFVEHLHPTFLGNARIASAIADSILGRPSAPLSMKEAADLLSRSDLTACDLAFADGRIAQLYRRWPYTRTGPDAPPFPYRAASVAAEARKIMEAAGDSATAADLAPDALEQRAADDLLSKRATLVEAHVRLAQAYAQAGRWSRAERHLRAASRLFPVDDRIWVALGESRLRRGDRAGAASAANAAVYWNPASAAGRDLLRRLGN
jgi:lysophospholipase L1-like esterase